MQQDLPWVCLLKLTCSSSILSTFVYVSNLSLKKKKRLTTGLHPRARQSLLTRTLPIFQLCKNGCAVRAQTKPHTLHPTGLCTCTTLHPKSVLLIPICPALPHRQLSVPQVPPHSVQDIPPLHALCPVHCTASGFLLYIVVLCLNLPVSN